MKTIIASIRASMPSVVKFARNLSFLLFVLASLAVIAAPLGSQAHAKQDEKLKRIGVMLFDGVLTSDVVAPLEVFGVAIQNEIIENIEIVTIADTPGAIKTHEGLTIHADYGLADAPDLDVVIVGSRYDMDPVLENKAFMSYVAQQAKEADWVASNCSGAYVLAAAGLLNGVRATTYPGGEVWLKLNHPSINIDIDETVVVDGRFITSNGSLVSYAAAIELLKKVAGPYKSKEVAETLYFTRLLKRYGDAAH